MRARYYDPMTGGFISKDPVEGILTNPQTQNPYAFAGNNPINVSDPSGEYWGPLSIDNIHADWNNCNYGTAIAKGAVVAGGTGLAAVGGVYVGAIAIGAVGAEAAVVGIAGVTLWPAAQKGGTIINGLKYSGEALSRMEPVGFGGRGVPPSVVQNALEYGNKTPGNLPGRIVSQYENVKVVANETLDTIITVIKTGH